MARIAISVIINAVQKRYDDVNSQGFLYAFGAFASGCIRPDMKEGMDGAYIQWILNKLAVDGVYMSFTNISDIPKRLANDRALVLDIKEKGVLEPVVLEARDYSLHGEAKYGFQLGGYHRTVAAWVCGQETVPCKYGINPEDVPQEIREAVI